MTKPRMRTINAYYEVLHQIRDIIWSENDPDTGDPILNPEKVLMVTLLEDVARALNQVGLRPSKRMRYRRAEFPPLRTLVVMDNGRPYVASDAGVEVHVGTMDDIPPEYYHLQIHLRAGNGVPWILGRKPR